MLNENEQQNSNVADAQSEKIRYGAPDGPRKKCRANYDGREPLEFPGHESAAWHLAFPKELRDFKSIAELANNFSVTRKTVHSWMRDIDVMKRAHFLSMQNQMIGDLHVRREYPSIMEKALTLAKKGNIAAMKFCIDRAFPVDKHAKESGISSLSIDEVIERAEQERQKTIHRMTPSWMIDRKKHGEIPEIPPIEEHHLPEDPKSDF